MDLKRPGNVLYLIGETKNELGGSHFALVNDLDGGQVPTVDSARAKATFAAVHRAIDAGLVAACHDLSEGGLAAAIAEMSFAGGLGADVFLDPMPGSRGVPIASLLFSESNTRFLCEIEEDHAAEFESLLAAVPHANIGVVRQQPELRIALALFHRNWFIDVPISRLKDAWQRPLKW
jgi:phosphoribosylformylglycinamidine synthase